MQRPRLEFGIVQPFYGRPKCGVAIEFPFMEIALPADIKPDLPTGDPVTVGNWVELTPALHTSTCAYLAKQNLLGDPVRTRVLELLKTLSTDVGAVYVRWVPGLWV